MWCARAHLVCLPGRGESRSAAPAEVNAPSLPRHRDANTRTRCRQKKHAGAWESKRRLTTSFEIFILPSCWIAALRGETLLASDASMSSLQADSSNQARSPGGQRCESARRPRSKRGALQDEDGTPRIDRLTSNNNKDLAMSSKRESVGSMHSLGLKSINSTGSLRMPSVPWVPPGRGGL